MVAHSFRVLAGCFFANYRLTKSSYYAYQNHPVNFVTDTDYLHWNTSFPQIVVCETESSRVPTSLEFVEKHYPEYYKDDMEFALLVHSFVFEPVCNKCSFNCDDNNNPICDINFNFKELSRKLKWPCKKLMKDCVWNGEPFDCCSKFETVDTELGFCFSANPSAGQSELPIMVVNKHTGPAGVEFKVTRPVEVKEIKNDEALIYEDFEKRKCKFPHETELKRFDRYTESTMCNVYGLKCLGDHNLLLRGFRLKGAAYRAWIECDCPPSCVEPEYNVVYKECSKKRIPLISLAILKKCNYLVLKGYLSEII
ncbi:uncharacterized protein GBIM_00447 [Gryllus bimaculatus]|nr:uncharacterized protein GBIM_00447 [Gryllus bimaculatus]